MRVYRFSVALLFALTLVSAQQAGMLHALSHIGKADTPAQQKHHPGEKVCDKCVAYAGLYGAATPVLAVLPVAERHYHFSNHLAQPALRRAVAPYRSRAPPLLP